VRKLRLVQAAVIILALIGAASTLLVGLAIQDIYAKLDDTFLRLCVTEIRQWQATEAVAGRLNPPATLPPRPVIPITARQCTARPSRDFPPP